MRATAPRTISAPGPWHSRGYLPHFDQPGLVQAITFRLADALPAAVVAALQRDLLGSEQRRQRLEDYLDAGYGACHLRDPSLAELVQVALLHFDGARYRLLAWVVMPNHVHALIETSPGYALREVVQAWKSFTAREANRLLGQRGRFWQPDYFDRAIRDERHLSSVVRYIHDNPVKAGLVASAEGWPFSSAARLAE
jgi:REP element-mobilizing transposase RayT